MGKKIIVLLAFCVLLTGGGLFDNTPSYSAQQVEFSRTDIVKPGQSNTSQLGVSLPGLSTVRQYVWVTFEGATIAPGSQTNAWTTSFDSSTDSTRNCDETKPGIHFWTGTSVSGQCLISPNGFTWAGAQNQATPRDVGGKFGVYFDSGSLIFASSGPYTVKVYLDNLLISTQTLTPPAQSTLSISSTSTTFGTPLTLTTSGGSGNGAVTYQVSNGTNTTGCSVSGGVLTSTSAGTCLVTATKAADSTYPSISSAQTTVTIAKASRIISFGTTSYTLPYGSSQQLSLSANPTQSLTDGTVTYSATGNGCTVSSSGLVSVRSATESCTVSASIAAGTNYLSAVSTNQVTISPTKKAVTLTGTSLNVSFGTTYTPGATTPDGSLASNQSIDTVNTTYTFTGSDGTNYGTTKPTNAGGYTMTVSNAKIVDVSNVDYTDFYNISYLAGSVTISKVAGSISFSGSTSRTVQFGDTTTVVATTSSDGEISFSRGSSNACSVDSSSGLVTVTSGIGTCVIYATVAEGTNYLSATTVTPVTITVAARALTLSAQTNSVTVGNSLSPSFSISSGDLVGDDEISGVTYLYAGSGSTSYASSSTAPTLVGTYNVTPSAAVFSSGSLSNYAITYAVGNFAIEAKLARTLNLSTTALSLEYGDTRTVVATPSAGFTDGVLSYSVGSSTACSVGTTTGLLTITQPVGTCVLNASMSEGANYLSVSASTPLTVTVSARALTITASAEDITQGGSLSPSFAVTEGSLVGSDEISTVTYTYLGTGSTIYAASTTKPQAAGTYSVIASLPQFASGSASNYALNYVAGTLKISPPAVPTMDISMQATVGMFVAGTAVTYSAQGLLEGSPYSVVVRSTPQTLASGIVTAGSVASSAKIPSGLGAGWHTLTFSSTAADGSAVSEVMYFKVSDSGMLLSTSTVMPAELAFTGSPQVAGMGITALLLLVSGVGLLWIRRPRFSMVCGASK